MRRNRVFFPQAALDQWLEAGRVELDGMQLSMLREGRRYQLVEGVRVMRELAGAEDLYEVIGRVKTVAFLTELDAELLGDSMIIGDAAYEVIPGFLGRPIGSFGEHQAARARESATEGFLLADEPNTDEDLLGRFMLRTVL